MPMGERGCEGVFCSRDSMVNVGMDGRTRRYGGESVCCGFEREEYNRWRERMVCGEDAVDVVNKRQKLRWNAIRS